MSLGTLSFPSSANNKPDECKDLEITVDAQTCIFGQSHRRIGGRVGYTAVCTFLFLRLRAREGRLKDKRIIRAVIWRFLKMGAPKKFPKNPQSGGSPVPPETTRKARGSFPPGSPRSGERAARRPRAFRGESGEGGGNLPGMGVPSEFLGTPNEGVQWAFLRRLGAERNKIIVFKVSQTGGWGQTR
jgi:hypothetical protein